MSNCLLKEQKEKRISEDKSIGKQRGKYSFHQIDQTLCLKPIDIEYCLSLAKDYGTLDLTQLRKALNEMLLFGYDVYEDGIRQGVVVALKIHGFYSLDGYNEKGSFWGAVKAGKKVCEELFENYTDTIYTCHDINARRITLLAKRIGFREYKKMYENIILKMEKSYGN